MHYRLLRLVQHQSKQHETNSSLQMFIYLVIGKGEAFHGLLLGIYLATCPTKILENIYKEGSIPHMIPPQKV